MKQILVSSFSQNGSFTTSCSTSSQPNLWLSLLQLSPALSPLSPGKAAPGFGSRRAALGPPRVPGCAGSRPSSSPKSLTLPRGREGTDAFRPHKFSKTMPFWYRAFGTVLSPATLPATGPALHPQGLFFFLFKLAHSVSDWTFSTVAQNAWNKLILLLLYLLCRKSCP